LIALDDLVWANLFAGVLIHLAIADAVARFLVDLIEADFLALAGRGEKLNRTRHQGKAQEALPVRARGHETLLLGPDVHSTILQRTLHRFVAQCSQSVPVGTKVSKNLSMPGAQTKSRPDGRLEESLKIWWHICCQNCENARAKFRSCYP